MPLDIVSSQLEKIAKECREVGASEWQIIKILNELQESKENDLVRLRAKTIALLKDINPTAAETYASFNRMLVHTSSQLIRPFDKGNIVKSLTRETTISRQLAEKIGSEVEEHLKNLKIRYVNTALIRTLVDAKLLDYGKESIHWQYTRVGMPLHDVLNLIEKEPVNSPAVMTEFNLFRIIPKKLSHYHFNADIHISNIEDFSTRFYSGSIQIKEVPKRACLIPFLLNQFKKFRQFYSLAPAFSGFDFFASKEKNDSKENAQLYSSFFESLYMNEKILPVVMLHGFVPEGMEKICDIASLGKFNNFFLKANLEKENYYSSVLLDNEFRLKLFDEKSMKNTIILNAPRKVFCTSKSFFTDKKGVLSSIGVNLSKQATDFQGREEKFFEKLSEIIDAINRLNDIKSRQLERRAYLEDNELFVSDYSPNVGFDSLFGSSKIFLEKEFVDKEVIKFSEKVFAKFNEHLSEGTLINYFSDQNGLKRFTLSGKLNRSKSPSKDRQKNILSSDLINAKMCFEFAAKDYKKIPKLFKSGNNLIVYSK